MKKAPSASLGLGGKLTSEDLPALAVLVLLILFANILLIFINSSWQDLHAFSYDFEVNYQGGPSYFFQTYGAGRFPLWGGWAGGIPVAALYAGSLFHFSSQIYWLPTVKLMVSVHTIFHLELLGLFLYLLCRQLGFSIFAALAGALWGALSGYPVWVSPIMSVIAPLPWFVCWMWTVVRFVERPGLSAWLGQSAALALLMTSGDLQELTYAAYLGGLWLFLLLLFFRQFRLKLILPLLAAPALALLIASLQILPSLFFFSRTVKTTTFSWDYYRETFPHLPDLTAAAIGLFSKRFKALFFCLSAASFLFLGLRRTSASPPLKAGLVVVLLALLFLAAGRYGLGQLLLPLPLLGKMFRHYKTGIVLQPLIILAAAWGVDEFLRRRSERKSRSWFLAGLASAVALLSPSWPAAILLALLAVAVAFFPLSRRGCGFAVAALAFLECSSVLWYPLSRFPRWQYWDEYMKACQEAGAEYRVGTMYPAPAMLNFDYLSELPVQPGSIFGEEGIDFWFSYPMKSYAAFLRLLNPACFLEEAGGIRQLDFATPFRSMDYITPANRHLLNLAGLKFICAKDFALAEADYYPLLSDPGYVLNPANRQGFAPYRRVIIRQKEEEGLALETDRPAVFSYPVRLNAGHRVRFGVEMEGAKAGAVVSFLLLRPGPEGRRLLFSKAVRPGEERKEGELVVALGVEKGAEEEKGPEAGQEYRLEFSVLFPAGAPATALQARWLDPVIIRPEKTLRHRTGRRLMLLDNTEALPRARLVHTALRAEDESEAAAVMADAARYDPRRQTVLLGAEAPAGFESGPVLEGEGVKVVRHYIDEVELEAELQTPGFLVWAGNYFPGWRVWVDGREEKVLRADLWCRAVALEPGHHRVIFRYVPAEFRIGLFLSLVSGLALLLFFLGCFVLASIRQKEPV